MSPRNDENERMSEDWETVPKPDNPPHPEDEYPIESEFRDGRERTRQSTGEFESLSMAIISTYASYNNLTPEQIANKFDVSKEAAQEHLDHVRRVYGPTDTEPAEAIQEQQEQERIRKNSGHAEHPSGQYGNSN